MPSASVQNAYPSETDGRTGLIINNDSRPTICPPRNPIQCSVYVIDRQMPHSCLPQAEKNLGSCRQFSVSAPACMRRQLDMLRKGVLLCDTYIPHRRLPLVGPWLGLPAARDPMSRESTVPSQPYSATVTVTDDARGGIVGGGIVTTPSPDGGRVFDHALACCTGRTSPARLVEVSCALCSKSK